MELKNLEVLLSSDSVSYTFYRTSLENLRQSKINNLRVITEVCRVFFSLFSYLAQNFQKQRSLNF